MSIVLSPTGGSRADVVSQFVLRLLLSRFVAPRITSKELLGRSEVRGLLQRHGGVSVRTCSKASGTTILERCRRVLAEVTERLQMLPITPRDILTIELTHALQMSHAEQSLLRLAIYTADHPDIRLAMDLVERGDSRDSAAAFAAALDMDPQQVHEALVLDSPLHKVEYMECHSDCRPSELLQFPKQIGQAIAKADATAKDVLSLLFGTSPEPKLTLADFPDQKPALAVLCRYLINAISAGQPGVNVLLHGRPGTGKTELVRAVAAELELTLFEVATTDDNNDPLPSWRRVTSYVAAQQVARQRDQVVVMFDETEDVFPSAGGDYNYGMQMHHSRPGRTKGWMNGVLECNAKPAFWISNDISHMDGAYLRRFDIVLEIAGPSRASRQRMIDEMFKDLPVSLAARTGLRANSALSPGHLERIAKVLRLSTPATEQESEATIDLLSRSAGGGASRRDKKALQRRVLNYRPECVNTDFDLEALVLALADLPVARLCLYGPPGTGKTEWGRYVAEQLGKPLHIRRASDLTGIYVGQTEKRIRRAFDEAEQAGAVLMIDEADSFIRSREQASQSWEVRMVNEFLTCMEDFQGLFVASTNLMDQLDPASARRFDFKVHFRNLDRAQRRSMFAELLCKSGNSDHMGVAELAAIDRLDQLTLGDFANVARQLRLLRTPAHGASVAELLRREVQHRPGSRGQIGFAASSPSTEVKLQ